MDYANRQLPLNPNSSTEEEEWANCRNARRQYLSFRGLRSEIVSVLYKRFWECGIRRETFEGLEADCWKHREAINLITYINESTPETIIERMNVLMTKLGKVHDDEAENC